MPFASEGDVISREVAFSAADIARFAADVGDINPLHYDSDYADATRFGGIIVSGSQLLGHFYSTVASHFSTDSAMVGLESGFKLLAPAYPDQPLSMTWTVTSVEDKPRVGGQVVDLSGAVTATDGTVVMSADFKVLVVAQL